MNVPFVDLKAQYRTIKTEIDRAISDVIEDAAFVGGKYVDAFEKDFARYCGATHCVGVGNGTDALCLTLRGLGIGPGDEVITAANSFIATSEAVTLSGARVVFADCDLSTRNIDCERVRRVITSRTRAIIPVHLYGLPADMPELTAVARERGLYLIEDAAQAHGAEVHGKRVGTWGHAACFSFYPGKNLGAYGDGGAVVTDDSSLADKIRLLSNHGRMGKYDHEIEGTNSRLDGLQAAILRVKLRFLDQWVAARRAAARAYTRLLDGSGIVLPAEMDGFKHVYHLYVVRVPDRDRVMKALAEKGIAAGIHYPTPLPMLQAYRHLGHTTADFPAAVRCSQEILSLPMFPELTMEQITYVSDVLRAARSS